MRAQERGAARRYARALFELAEERGQADDVRRELREACATLEAHGELRALLDNPAVPGPKKKAVVAALWSAREGGAGLVARLLQLLAERHRAGALRPVEELYGELLNAQRKVLTAELLSAAPLEEGQVEALRGAVRDRTGRDVEFKTAVDERVLGGVRLTMDGRVYDGTVRARLAALRARLAAAGGA